MEDTWKNSPQESYVLWYTLWSKHFRNFPQRFRGALLLIGKGRIENILENFDDHIEFDLYL